jgi:hypothetical protein
LCECECECEYSRLAFRRSGKRDVRVERRRCWASVLVVLVVLLLLVSLVSLLGVVRRKVAAMADELEAERGRYGVVYSGIERGSRGGEGSGSQAHERTKGATTVDG